MILAPVPLADGTTVGTPIAVRLIGVLDRTLIEAFSESCAGLMVVGRRTLIVSIRDVLAMRDDSLRRFIATLDAYRVAGHDVRVDGNATWTKLFREASTSFPGPAGGDDRATRRQIIIAHSLVNAKGARAGRTAKWVTASTSG
jgi:hypothetical protein